MGKWVKIDGKRGKTKNNYNKMIHTMNAQLIEATTCMACINQKKKKNVQKRNENRQK